MPPRVVPGAIVVSVRLTPRAARDSVDGIGRLADGRDAIFAHVRAPPDRGAANKSLVALLAKALDVPKSAVTITAGGSQRLKQFRISGDSGVLSSTIAAWPRLS